MDLTILTPDDLAPVLNRLAVLEEKAAVYDCLVQEYVSQKFALKFCKIDPKSLKKEREKPDATIKFRMTGKKGTTPVYLFESLAKYNKLKQKPTNRQMYLESKQANAA